MPNGTFDDFVNVRPFDSPIPAIFNSRDDIVRDLLAYRLDSNPG
jgi:hypothetical protein